MKAGQFNTSKSHKEVGKKYITLSFRTDVTKNARMIRIPKWIKYPLMILSVVLVWQGVSYYSYVTSLELALREEQQKVQEVTLENDTKVTTITDLETELEQTNQARYEEITELKDLAVRLGLKLDSLEAYRDEMEELKEEIDTNLGTGDDSSYNDSDEDDTSSDVLALSIDPNSTTIPLSTSSLNSSTDYLYQGGPMLDVYSDFTYMLTESEDLLASMLTTTQDYENYDFSGEVSLIRNYLQSALNEVSEDQAEYAETSSELSDMIPYLEAYPSVLPIENTYITSPFGYRSNPFGGYSGEFHTGIDLKATYEPVAATGAGTVVVAQYLSGYGYTVVIDHGYGLSTKYAHNSQLYVSVGDTVERGDIISKSGNTGRSTGPHLHYEILLNGEPQNPLDYIYKENE